MMAVMRAAGAARTTGSAGLTDCSSRPRGIRTAGIRRRAGTIGKSVREHTLQFRRLRAGQFATGNFAGNQVIDLRLQIAGRRTGAAGRSSDAGTAALQRGIDIGQRGGQRALVGRTDGAGRHFRLQFVLQLLQRRKVIAVGRRRD